MSYDITFTIFFTALNLIEKWRNYDDFLKAGHCVCSATTCDTFNKITITLAILNEI